MNIYTHPFPPESPYPHPTTLDHHTMPSRVLFNKFPLTIYFTYDSESSSELLTLVFYLMVYLIKTLEELPMGFR